MRPLGQVFKHRPRDLASVNGMKQTCVIVFLAYFIQRHRYACHVFANESIGEMISHGRNTFQCNGMHANQGPILAFSSKSHFQTARESHDLNMDFAASNSFA